MNVWEDLTILATFGLWLGAGGVGVAGWAFRDAAFPSTEPWQISNTRRDEAASLFGSFNVVGFFAALSGSAWLLPEYSAWTGRSGVLVLGAVWLAFLAMTTDFTDRARPFRHARGLTFRSRILAVVARQLLAVTVMIFVFSIPLSVELMPFVLFALAAAGLCIVLFRQPWLLKKLGVLRRASGELDSVAAELGLPTDAVFEWRAPYVNAFAIRPGTVAFASGMIVAFSTDELVSIGRHELAHLSQRNLSRRFVVAALFAVTVGGIVLARRGQLNLPLLVIYVLLLVLLIRFDLRSSRHNELGADEAATQADDPSYASALVKVYRLGGRSVARRFGSHPSLVARLRALGHDVDEPKVLVPRTRRAHARGGVRRSGLGRAVLRDRLATGIATRDRSGRSSGDSRRGCQRLHGRRHGTSEPCGCRIRGVESVPRASSICRARTHSREMLGLVGTTISGSRFCCGLRRDQLRQPMTHRSQRSS